MTTATELSEDALTIRETASRLGVSIRQVMGLIADNKLTGTYKFGLLRLVPKESVEARIRQVETWKATRGCGASALKF